VTRAQGPLRSHLMSAEMPTRRSTVDLKAGHLGITMTDSAFPILGGVSLKWRHEKDLAAKAGLAAGDLILSLNKTPVSDHTEALAVIPGCTMLEIEWLKHADAERLAIQKKMQQDAQAPGIGRRLLQGALIVYCLSSAMYRMDEALTYQPKGGFNTPAEGWPEWAVGPIQSYRELRGVTGKRRRSARNSRATASEWASPKAVDIDTDDPYAAAEALGFEHPNSNKRKDRPAPTPPKAKWDDDDFEDHLEDIELRLDGMDEAELCEHIRASAGAEHYEAKKAEYEKMSAGELRSKIMASIRADYYMNKAERDEEKERLRLEKRKNNPLMGKSLEELFVMLSWTGTFTDDGGPVEAPEVSDMTKKLLRQLIMEHNVIEKWENLNEEQKLQANQYALMLQVHQEKKRKKMEQERRKHDGSQGTEFLKNVQQTSKPWWEQEWSEEDESEAIRRLSKTTAWASLSLDDAMLKKTLEAIKANPKILDVIEQERSAKSAFAAKQLEADIEGKPLRYEDIADMGYGSMTNIDGMARHAGYSKRAGS